VALRNTDISILDRMSLLLLCCKECIGSVVAIIDKIRAQWSTKFDCVLEQWLIRHPEDNSKEAFSEASTGKTYTWEDILVELRKQTPVGKSFEQKLNEYYIYQLNRSKK
jgi:hypothetical protein